MSLIMVSLVTAEFATFAFTFFCMWVAIKFLLGVSIIRPFLNFIFKPIATAVRKVAALYRRRHAVGTRTAGPIASFLQRRKPTIRDEEKDDK